MAEELKLTIPEFTSVIGTGDIIYGIEAQPWYHSETTGETYPLALSKDATYTAGPGISIDNKNVISLSIASGGGLQTTAAGALSLKIDSSSPLQVTSNGLTLSIGDGLQINDNHQLTIDPSILVDVTGTHKTLAASESTESIEVNNYVYQELN